MTTFQLMEQGAPVENNQEMGMAGKCNPTSDLRDRLPTHCVMTVTTSSWF